MTFRERFMAGQADFEEIFDLTDKWNFSDETCTLREYLGLTAEEEDVWISDSDEALEELMGKEKKRKIFFTDLDDTLLNRNKQITSGNRKAIETMLKEGHVVVITTGRALTSAIKQAKELKLIGKNCYIICYNGGQIYDTESRKLIHSQSIPMELVRSALDDAHAFGIHAQTYSDTLVLSEHENENFKKYCDIQLLDGIVVPDATKELDKEPPKVLVIDYANPENITRFRDHIQDKYAGKLDLFRSHIALLEMVPPGVNKGTAIRFLCKYLGIPIENSVAAGDAENDLTMIQAAHVGAAMCNGVPQVKEQANYITEADCDHDGVAEIIYKFILNK